MCVCALDTHLVYIAELIPPDIFPFSLRDSPTDRYESASAGTSPMKWRRKREERSGRNRGNGGTGESRVGSFWDCAPCVIEGCG